MGKVPCRRRRRWFGRNLSAAAGGGVGAEFASSFYGLDASLAGLIGHLPAELEGRVWNALFCCLFASQTHILPTCFFDFHAGSFKFFIILIIFINLYF